jgi:hypothetical protein
MRTRLSFISPVLLICAALAAGCGSQTTTSKTSSASGTGQSGTGTSQTGTATSAGSGVSAQIGFEGVPLEQGAPLAPASTTQTGTVDGITCGPTEQLAYHIHAHLAVFQNGSLYQLPAGVGIPGSHAQQTNQGPIAAGGHCIYWLHTHTTDGIIHVESPTKRIYTLGNFFDIWHQPLGQHGVASLHGAVTAFVNGKPWTKNPRDIPLDPHAEIQLEIGQPAPPIMTVDWSQTQL